MNEQQLLRKKQQIEKAKHELSELKGELKSLNRQLKTEFDCETLQEAKKQILSYEKELKKMKEDIDEKTSVLEADFFNEEEEQK